MKIIVCIKQIPDTNNVKWSSDNNIIRDGLISVINPYDLYGIMTAKSIENSEITLLSMGPENAKESLSYGLALGADKAVLLTDRKFMGSDTLATAKTLACAIKNHIKEYDLIITGQFALDGDTAQTSYSLANFLNLPHIGYVNKIEETDKNHITVTSIKDDGIYKIKGEIPLVVSISKFEGEIYKPLVKDYMRAQDKKIEIVNAEEITINCEDIGIKGSPTYVSKAFRPKNERICRFINKNELIGEF